MKAKFLLPVLAMIFAIGMSFANVEKANDLSTDYILENGTFRSIGMEVNCNPGNKVCQIQFEQGGSIYEVYDSADLNTLKDSGEGIIKLWE